LELTPSAGRVGILELDPLTAAEAQTGKQGRDWKRVWLHGGFPDALGGAFREWWEAYLRTYVERDLPHLGVGAEPLLLRRLLTILAHSQGSLLNSSQLGKALGVSYHTVQRYLDILEQTFLLRRLPPYFRNIGRRLVKSPKLYLRDTGLLHHLLNISSAEELEATQFEGSVGKRSFLKTSYVARS
jgi:predicted AAA+ superfamily ATPase